MSGGGSVSRQFPPPTVQQALSGLVEPRADLAPGAWCELAPGRAVRSAGWRAALDAQRHKRARRAPPARGAAAGPRHDASSRRPCSRREAGSREPRASSHQVDPYEVTGRRESASCRRSLGPPRAASGRRSLVRARTGPCRTECRLARGPRRAAARAGQASAPSARRSRGAASRRFLTPTVQPARDGLLQARAALAPGASCELAPGSCRTECRLARGPRRAAARAGQASAPSARRSRGAASRRGPRRPWSRREADSCGLVTAKPRDAEAWSRTRTRAPRRAWRRELGRREPGGQGRSVYGDGR